jgi:hypothetical protein
MRSGRVYFPALPARALRQRRVIAGANTEGGWLPIMGDVVDRRTGRVITRPGPELMGRVHAGLLGDDPAVSRIPEGYHDRPEAAPPPDRREVGRGTDEAEARLAGLRYVEVETSRRCNRTCAWCPNGHSGARKEQELMEWPLFARIIDQLGKARYAGWFAFHNYNEPLLNPRLDAELSWLGYKVPHARPAIYTNGDRLTVELLASLIAAGVRYVRVTRYPHDASARPSYEALRGWMRQAGLLDAVEWEWRPVRQGLAARWEHPAGGVLVEVISPAIAGYNDRGGTALLPVTIPRLRTDPCGMTSTSMSIDYRGVVKMCCNVIPDSAAAHERYVVGSAAETPLADLWAHPLMQEWRTRHAAADWSASPACRTCVQALPETRQ